MGLHSLLPVPELAGKPAWIYIYRHQSHLGMPVWAQALVVLGVGMFPHPSLPSCLWGPRTLSLKAGGAGRVLVESTRNPLVDN